MRRDHDVIVVGAGPAGAHLALRLARGGWSVALLDAKRFPRPKQCGEFLGPDCLPLLDELGLLEGLERLGAQPVRRMELFGYGRAVGGGFAELGRALGRAPLACDHGVAVRRDRLDEAAARAAQRADGVELFEGCPVGELLRAPDGRVEGVRARREGGERLELFAPFTIGADGLRSRVARELGAWTPLRWLDRLSITTRARCEGLEEHAEVHFLPESRGRAPGYVGLAPSSAERANVNLVVDRSLAPRGRAALPAFVADALGARPALAQRLALPTEPAAYSVCGPFAARTTAQAFDGAALVGDAAGYVDPVTGEGLYFAMRGAALLAEALDGALRARRTDAGALRGYARQRAAEFRARRLFALALQRAMRSESLSSGVLALLEARPRLFELMLGLTGSGVPARELLHPRVLLPALARG